jgi:hypothetical protein
MVRENKTARTAAIRIITSIRIQVTPPLQGLDAQAGCLYGRMILQRKFLNKTGNGKIQPGSARVIDLYPGVFLSQSGLISFIMHIMLFKSRSGHPVDKQ